MKCWSRFPKLSGGVAVYAHEAWKRYTSFVGPIAAVGYWLGWSVVLSLNGAIVGFLGVRTSLLADATTFAASAVIFACLFLLPSVRNYASGHATTDA